MSTPTDTEHRARLGQRVPAGRRPDDDEILEQFLEWTIESKLELYPAQEEAVLELVGGNHVILHTPTGSGKSLVAVAAHFRSLCRGERSFYTSPIKALVSEKFFDLCEEFGPENVGLMTGDASVNRDAPILCGTAEILSNLVLRQGSQVPFDNVIMDEFHYYADRDRGSAWQVPLITMPWATFLLMSATLGDTRNFETRLREATHRRVSVVRSTHRPVPLDFEYREVPIHETIAHLIENDRAPIYIVNFTQRECAEQAQNLTSTKIITREQRQKILAELVEVRFDSPYGKDIQRFIKAGIGVHHAGLLPRYRLAVERLAQQGLLKVICGTDTLGVGVNIPIRTVLFAKLCKYDGTKTSILAVRDFKQIAGRAGRKGFDTQGWVVCQAPEHVIENKRLDAKTASSGGKRKFVRRNPPERGYVPWDESTYRRLQGSDPEPLRSRLRVDHGMLINLLQRSLNRIDGRPDNRAGYGALVDLIASSYESEPRQSRLRHQGAQLFRALRQAGIVELYPRPEMRGRDVRLADGLQRDFSLFHTLSLYLLEAVFYLDPADEDFALDVLTLVESVLEDPQAILRRQVDKLKDQRVAEMKAEGIEYEQRMEELEKLSHPKPKAEFIYQTFTEFTVKHPWVGDRNIHPKSVARDMYERYASFSEYINEYGMARLEGGLLRYLSQAYKTLVQNVPDSHKTEAVLDMIAYLRTLLRRVDSSLTQEWEQMLNADPLAAEAPEAEARAVDISRDGKTFRARIRAELHHIVQALAAKDFGTASTAIRSTEHDLWTEERFAAALDPFFSEHTKMVFDHRARMADKTFIQRKEQLLWTVRQVLLDPDDDNIWVLEGEVDLREDTNPAGALITLRRIGV
ncbi:MAG: DUF3516 domain-containing protein [Nannocystaceae bacterium]